MDDAEAKYLGRKQALEDLEKHLQPVPANIAQTVFIWKRDEELAAMLLGFPAPSSALN